MTSPSAQNCNDRDRPPAKRQSASVTIAVTGSVLRLTTVSTAGSRFPKRMALRWAEGGAGEANGGTASGPPDGRGMSMLDKLAVVAGSSDINPPDRMRNSVKYPGNLRATTAGRSYDSYYVKEMLRNRIDTPQWPFFAALNQAVDRFLFALRLYT